MENASKALLMGAGILIGILLIALAVRVYSSASEVTKSFQSREEISEIRTFNSNFSKFIGAQIDNSRRSRNSRLCDNL